MSEEKPAAERLAEQKLAEQKAGNRLAIGCAVVLGIFILIIVISYVSTPKIPDRRYESIGTDKQITDFIELGFLKRIDAFAHEAFIDDSYWRGVDFQSKEEVASWFGFYCGRVSGDKMNWVTIRDHLSGKQVGEYTESSGLQIK